MLIDDLRQELRVRDGYWFATKLFGFGATPVTWQGWATLVGFVAIVIAAAAMVRDPVAIIAVVIALAVPFAALTYAKTDGGWHWRWGTHD